MLEVSDDVRNFLTANYGLAPNSAMFIPENEPKKVCVKHNGALRVFDFSSPNESGGLSGNSANSIAEAQFDRTEMKSGRPVSNSFSEAGGIASAFGAQRWQSISDVERGVLQKEFRKANAYKTALCQAFKDNGFCYYGEACRFAHGEHELRLPPQVHPKHKTQLCNKFALFGRCPYGPRCQFIHRRPSSVTLPQPDLHSACDSSTNPRLMETGTGSNALTLDGSLQRCSSGYPGFSSSLSAEQFRNAMFVWQQRPSNVKLEDMSSDGLSRPIRKSDKKTEDGLDAINAGNSGRGIWGGSDKWPIQPENNFARSCFSRLQNGSIWRNGV